LDPTFAGGAGSCVGDNQNAAIASAPTITTSNKRCAMQVRDRESHDRHAT
jgi:hypothetical protein